MSEETQASQEEAIVTTPVVETATETTEASEFPDFSDSKPVAKKTPKTPGKKKTTTVSTKTKKKTTKAKAKPKAKAVKVSKSPREIFIRKVLNKTGLTELPTLEHLTRGKQGKLMKISDIAIFTEAPTDVNLKEIYPKCNQLNEINFHAPMNEKRVITVGKLIMGSGKMHEAISVAQVEGWEAEDGKCQFQCTSGRHRLALYAILYGESAKVRVSVEEMPLKEAYDAVPFANGFSRPTTNAEKAEHHAMIQTNGDLEGLNAEDIFAKFSGSAASIKKFFIYSLYNNLIDEVEFKVGPKGQGGVCTEGAFKGYAHESVGYHKGMTFDAFMEKLNGSIAFLNAYYKEAKEFEGFDQTKGDIVSSKPLGGVGKVFKFLVDSKKDPIINAEEVAGVMIGLASTNSDFATQQSNTVYQSVVDSADFK